MNARRISAVIFDLNGVLTHTPSWQDRRTLCSIAGIDEDILDRLYWLHRPAYDTGVIDSRLYWQRIGSAIGRTYDTATVAALVAADCRLWGRPNQDMAAVVHSVRDAGLRTAILSNTPRDVWTCVDERGDWNQKVDVMTLSFAVGVAKPESAIFGCCIGALGTPAAETLFVDDREDNVEVAIELGMRAIHFAGPSKWRAVVEMIGLTAS